jgi:hypothetical protein
MTIQIYKYESSNAKTLQKTTTSNQMKSYK